MKKLTSDILNWRKVIWLNFGIENKYSSHNSFPWINQTTIHDGSGLDQICLLMAKKDDHVYVRGEIPDFVLEGYTRAGITLPHIHVLSSFDRTAYTTDLLAEEYYTQIKSLDDYKLVPFGTTQVEENFAESMGKAYFGLNAKSAECLNSKIYLRTYANKKLIACPFGCIAETYQEANRFVTRYITQFPLIIKTEYGSSGTGIFTVHTVKEWVFLYKHLQKLPNTIPLLIERFYYRRDSFNYQLLAVNKNVYLISIKKQQVNRSLSYIGCDWPDHSPELKHAEFQHAVEAMKSLLLQHSRDALINIDGIIDNEGVLFPAIDLNARFSLTSYFTLSQAIQDSSYQCFRFRYYPYNTVNTGRIVEITKGYRFGKHSEAILLCCCKEPTKSSVGRIGVLYASNHEETMNALEKKFLELVE